LHTHHPSAAKAAALFPLFALFADHVADLPLLEAVGKPVVVGKSPALTRFARARGWEMIAHGT
jgi:phosphoserine phosphatase